MSEENPLESAASGAMIGALKYSEEKIKELVYRFKNKELAFIENIETIELVKKQRQKPAWKLISKYVTNKELRLPAEMGFILRELEAKNEQEKLKELKSKIHNKFKSKGIHIAELVQSNVLDRYVNLLVDKSDDDIEVKERLEEVLEDVDKYVIFYKTNQSPKSVAQIIISKLQTLSPKGIIIFSKGSCVVKAQTTITLIQKELDNYNIETQLENESKSRYDFILKKPISYSQLLS